MAYTRFNAPMNTSSFFRQIPTRQQQKALTKAINANTKAVNALNKKINKMKKN